MSVSAIFSLVVLVFLGLCLFGFIAMNVGFLIESMSKKDIDEKVIGRWFSVSILTSGILCAGALIVFYFIANNTLTIKDACNQGERIVPPQYVDASMSKGSQPLLTVDGNNEVKFYKIGPNKGVTADKVSLYNVEIFEDSTPSEAKIKVCNKKRYDGNSEVGDVPKTEHTEIHVPKGSVSYPGSAELGKPDNVGGQSH